MKWIKNLKAMFRKSPLRNIKLTLILFVVYAVIAFVFGYLGDLFKFQFLNDKMALILPFTLFIFPSLLEETFFRGILIPPKVFEESLKVKIKFILISAVLFTLWHPLNAFLFNQGAQPFFYNFYFLAIVFVLGMSCAVSYILSKSIYVPIIFHWITVIVWVLLLGGRNLIKEGGM